MPSLVCFDTIYPMEGEGFGKEFSAHKEFLLISVQYRSRSRFERGFIGSLCKNQVGHLVEDDPPYSSLRARYGDG